MGGYRGPTGDHHGKMSLSMRPPDPQQSPYLAGHRPFPTRNASGLRRLPAFYLPLLSLATLTSVAAALQGSFDALVLATVLSVAVGVLLVLNDAVIMWRRGSSIVGRLVVNLGVFYWFWVGALPLALADPPFPWLDSIYPGFPFGVPESIVGPTLIGVNLFALGAMLGWRYLPQPRRLIALLADRVDPQPAHWFDWVALGLVLLAWVPLVIAYQGDLSSALYDLMRIRAGGKIGASQDPGLAHHLVLLGSFGATLSLARIALRSSGLFWPRYLAVALMVPILFFGQGSRFNFGYLLIPAGVILLAPSRHRLSWINRRTTVIIIVAIGALLLLYQGAIRNTGYGGGAEAPSHSFGSTLEKGFYGHDHFSAMLVAVNLVDTGGRFYMEPMAPFFFTHFIPRIIWPNKPYPVSWADYNFAWTQGHQFNVTPSITGQYYLNWGYVGVIYIGFFIGWLARLCETWLIRLDIRHQIMSAAVAGLLMGFMFLSFRFFHPLYFSYPLFGFIAYRLLTRRLRRPMSE